MPKGTRKCKICGCEYPYCKTVTQDRFRYQDVACSPEHATEYFKKIELSRMTEEFRANPEDAPIESGKDDSILSLKKDSKIQHKKSVPKK